MTVGNRIAQRRKELDMTQEYLALQVGYKTKSSINKIELGVNDITRSKLEKIAAVLNTTPAYLMGWSDNPIAEEIILPDNIIPLPATRRIPLLGDIACGEPILATENLDGSVEIPEDIIADFALRCKGDSMINARIFNGDIVYIRQQPTVENGEIAAVLIDNDATLKRVHLYGDHISLEAENPQYRPLVYWGEDMNTVKILGKAVAFTSVIR